ncbi:hypothetical protein ACFYT4_24755 [Streptomyces sp. NPDC004609]|uniref:hypothetical protein n=1 Tax=Streptomyces sp. NPDC004609 TaxID=3364704 RepID=UPI0036C183A6
MQRVVQAWQKLKTRISRCAAPVKRVLDEYPGKVTPSGKAGQILFLCGVPLVIMALVRVACEIEKMATAPGCGPLTLLHLAFPAARDDVTDCRALPLTADLPSVALGFTSTLAMAIYLVLIARLSRLKDETVASGLVRESDFRTGDLAERLTKLDEGIRLGRAMKTALAAASIAGSVGLYLWAYRGGRAFADLAAVSAADPSVQSVRASWWANYTERPLLAAVWILIGSIGLYFATKQGYVYQRLLAFSWASRKAWAFQYVGRDRDDDFGWKPVGRIITMVYLGFLNFTVSLTAAAYLLRGESGDWKNPVVGLVALIGIWANAGILVALLTVMIKSHRSIVERRRAEVAAEIVRLNESGGPSGPAERYARLNYLSGQGTLLHETPRWYPLRGKLKPVFSLAPIVLALYKLGVELSKLL